MSSRKRVVPKKKPGRGQANVPSTSRAHPQDPLLERIDLLAELLSRHQLTELEIEQAGERIRLFRGDRAAKGTAGPDPHPAAPIGGFSPAASSGPSAAMEGGNSTYITSPFVGTFYRSPSPDALPFVDVGTRVRKGQVLCIVEAMKLMNEIESEVEGVIVQVLVENGQAVEYGEPLFKIRQE